MRLPWLVALCLVGLPRIIYSQAAPAPTTNAGTPNQQTEYVQNDPGIVDQDLWNASTALGTLVDVKSGTLSLQGVDGLLSATVCQSPTDCNLTDQHTYAAINIIRWSEPDAKTNAQTIVSSNWYLFNSSSSAYRWRNSRNWGQADFSGNNRFYGVRKLVVLFVDVNVWKATDCKFSAPNARYEIDIAKRTPTNIAALTQLATLIMPTGTDSAKFNAQAVHDNDCSKSNRYNFWGGRAFDVGYSTSDITIKSTIANPPSVQPIALAPIYQITSEPREYWDVSIAVPVKKISATEYNSSNGTVTPSQINRQNSFAVLDGYWPPVDLVGTTYSFVPHPLIGVSMASQPLHSVIAAMAVGTHFGELFVGDVFLTQQSGLHIGKNIIKGQFAVGINIPIKGAYASLKKTQ